MHHPELGQAVVKAMLDRLGIDSEALLDLGTDGMKQFNQSFLDHPQVRYFSVTGAGRSAVLQTSLFLFELYHHIRSVTGEDNDGLVAVSSARRWAADEQTWPADTLTRWARS
jgi:hypothetical protein